jgi:hypothetical protein
MRGGAMGLGGCAERPAIGVRGGDVWLGRWVVVGGSRAVVEGGERESDIGGVAQTVEPAG